MASTEQQRSFTQLIQFEIEPAQQDALVAALARQTERLAQGAGGFIRGNVQASDDGRRVLNLLQWQSQQAGEAALARFETGEEDFWALIRGHRATAVTFASFRLQHSIECSQDNALHCALVG